MFGRDITEEVKSEIEIVKNAESRTYEEALARGVAGGEPPAGELCATGPLPDCSTGAAECALAGWKASSPAQLAAEFYTHGAHRTPLILLCMCSYAS